MFKELIAVCAIALAGCSLTTSAGPFVTNIASAGDGRLVVEKCTVQYSEWTAAVSTGTCTTFTLDFAPPTSRYPATPPPGVPPASQAAPPPPLPQEHRAPPPPAFQ